MERTIVYNGGKCSKCCEVIESRHRHDFKYCKCGSSFVDGGLEYLRYGGELISLTKYLDDPHSQVREVFSRGSYGVNGDEPLHYILLKDMNKSHLEAILREEDGRFTQVYKNELLMR
jgi:hypothetical protein